MASALYILHHTLICKLIYLCFLESDEERHHDDKYFTTLLSVIEKFPELKIKTIELVANLARQGMPSSLHGPVYKILIYDIIEILIVKLVCDMQSEFIESQPQGYACMHHHIIV